MFFKSTIKSWGHSDAKNYYESDNASAFVAIREIHGTQVECILIVYHCMESISLNRNVLTRQEPDTLPSPGQWILGPFPS